VMALPSRCWPWRDIGAESCWRLCCQVDIGCGMMSLLSLAGVGVGAGAAEVMLAMVLLMTMLT
jgi:hypothetical protein